MYTELKNFLQSSFIYSFGNILNRGLYLISMPIMTRYMMPSEYGTLSIVNATVSLLMTFYGLAIPSFVMRSYYEYDTECERRKMLGAIVSFIFLFALIITVLLLIFGDSIFSNIFKDIPFSPYMILGIFICFLGIFEIIPNELFRIKNQAKLFISVTIAKTVLAITLSVVFVVVFKMGAEGPLGGSIIVALIFGVYYLYYLKDQIKLNVSIAIIKQSLRFSLPVLLLLLGRVLLDSLDRLILQRFTTLSIVGFYSIGATLGSVMVMIASSINSAWMPFYFEKAREKDKIKAKTILAYASSYMGSLILFIGLFPVMFREEIVHILAPPSYYPVVSIIPYIMIGAVLNALFYIPVMGIYQGKKTGYLPFIIFSGLSVNIVFNIVLIPKYHMLGAAMANMASAFIMLGSCFVLSQKIYYMPYQYVRLLKVLFVCIIFSYLSFHIPSQIIFVSIAVKTTIMALFPIALYVLKFFEQRELDVITQLCRQILILVKSRLPRTTFLK
jgi:O-antigen/teichoic acid export membrane protein